MANFNREKLIGHFDIGGKVDTSDQTLADNGHFGLLQMIADHVTEFL